jgi:predicted alpha/beta-hydrolase family hydrolase
MVELQVHLKSRDGPAHASCCQHRGVAKTAQVLEIDTPHGPARAHLHAAENPVGAVVLGHGAGGGVTTPDLTAATEAALSTRFSVALVEQPYRVAGRRSQAPAAQLDAAWTAAVEQLAEGVLGGLPLVSGGRSAGARVACRTAPETDAAGVLCLAFPLHPPGKAGDPAKSRQYELDAVEVPVLIVQGDRDAFGMPRPGRDQTLVTIPGTGHGLKTGLDRLREAIGDWLPRVVG